MRLRFGNSMNVCRSAWTRVGQWCERKGQRPGLGTGGPEVVEPLSWRQKHFRVIARTIGRREERELSVGVNKALAVD